MDDRKRFAALVFANQLGLIGKGEVIAAADQRILELDCPEYWLVEVSLYGGSEEFDKVIKSGNDEVFSDVLRKAYHAWTEKTVSNKQIVDCCKSIWRTAGYASKWYTDLVRIEDAFDLADMGYYTAENAKRLVKEAIETRLKGSL
jgi:hypothetical protein